MSAITAIQDYSKPQAVEATQAHSETGVRQERCAVTSWGQVDSVLREMAELQVAINREIGMFNRHVDKIEHDLREIGSVKRGEQQRMSLKAEIVTAAELLRERTQRLRARQLYWEKTLKRFMTVHYKQSVTIERHFRFGSVHCHGGEVDILLNVDYAKEVIGKA